MLIFDELKTRGVACVLFICMGGVSGLKEGAKSIFKNVVVQRCIVHLIQEQIKYRHPIKFCVNNNPSSNNKTADCGVIRLSDLPRVNFSFLSAEFYARFA